MILTNQAARKAHASNSWSRIMCVCVCMCVCVWLVHCKYITIWKQVNILNKHRKDPGRTGRRSRILWTFCCCFGGFVFSDPGRTGRRSRILWTFCCCFGVFVFSEVFSSSFEGLSSFFLFFFFWGVGMNLEL